MYKFIEYRKEKKHVGFREVTRFYTKLFIKLSLAYDCVIPFSFCNWNYKQ